MFRKIALSLLFFTLCCSVAELRSQSAITATVSLFRTSPYLEDYADFGNTIITLTSTDQRPMYQVRLEVEMVVGGQVFLLSPQIGMTPPITMGSNQTIVLQGADLLPYFSVNALDPAQRQDFVNNGGQLPEGMITVTVRAYDLNFLSGEPVSNDAVAMGVVQVNPPPIIKAHTGMDFYNDAIPVFDPQTANFRWEHFPPGGGNYQYTIEIWDNSLSYGFGDQFTVDNTPPYIQEPQTAPFLFTLGNEHLPLIAGREYIWRVNVQDVSGMHRFDNDGNSPIGRFVYGGEDVIQCYAPTELSGSGGNGAIPFTLSWQAASAARQTIHRFTIFNAQTEEIVSIDQYAPNTYSFAEGEADFRLTQVQGLLDTAAFPIRVELCVLCSDGSQSCEELVYGTITVPEEEDPCPAATQPEWILVDEETVTVNWEPGDPGLPYRARIIDRADERPNMGGLEGAADIGIGAGAIDFGGEDGAFGQPTLPPNTMTFTDLEAGHDYRVKICTPCNDMPTRELCRDIFFTLPDVADCNIWLLADLDEVAPDAATVSWTANMEWTDRFSVHLNGDSVMLTTDVSDYTFSDLVEGADYDAQVCAYCPGTRGDRECKTMAFTVPVSRCATIEDLENHLLTATTTAAGIEVNWSGFPTEISFTNTLLQIQDASTREVLATAQLSAESSSYTFENLTEGTNYNVHFCVDCDREDSPETLCYDREVTVIGCSDLSLIGLNAANVDADFAELYWSNPEGLTTDTYYIRWRESGDLNPYTEPIVSNEPAYRMEELLSNTTYDVLVCYTCETTADRCVETSFTTIDINCANAGDHPLEYVCGEDGTIEYTAGELMQNLAMGDSVWAGDFLVRMDEINGSSPFSGTGRMVIPHLNQAIVKVEFDGIKVDQNCRMVEGSMVVVPPYRELVEGLNDLMSDFNNSLNQIQAGLDQLINIVQSINDWANEWQDIFNAMDLIAEGASQNPFISPAVLQQLQDALDCMESASTNEEREACQQQVTDALEAYQEELNVIYGADFQVPFVANASMKYGYDVQTYPEMNQQGWYPSIPNINGRPYQVAWKSLKTGENDLINARRDPNVPMEGVTFINVDSTEVEFAAVAGGNEVSMSVDAAKGTTIYATQESTNAEGETRTKIAGQLAMVSYEEKPLVVEFVPVNSVNMSGITQSVLADSMKAIFKQAVMDFTVSLRTEPLVVDVPETFPARASGVRSYQREMRAVINANEEVSSYNEDTYYIFLVEDYATDDEGENRTGFMPRKRKNGFVFVDNVVTASNYLEGLSTAAKIARTAGHEIAHGAYHLRHVWEETPVGEQGAPDNLMAYQGGGRLHKWQWDLMHDPVRVNGLFEGDDDGSAMSDGQTFEEEGEETDDPSSGWINLVRTCSQGMTSHGKIVGINAWAFDEYAIQAYVNSKGYTTRLSYTEITGGATTVYEIKYRVKQNPAERYYVTDDFEFVDLEKFNQSSRETVVFEDGSSRLIRRPNPDIFAPETVNRECAGAISEMVWVMGEEGCRPAVCQPEMKIFDFTNAGIDLSAFRRKFEGLDSIEVQYIDDPQTKIRHNLKAFIVVSSESIPESVVQAREKDIDGYQKIWLHEHGGYWTIPDAFAWPDYATQLMQTNDYDLDAFKELFKRSAAEPPHITALLQYEFFDWAKRSLRHLQIPAYVYNPKDQKYNSLYQTLYGFFTTPVRALVDVPMGFVLDAAIEDPEINELVSELHNNLPKLEFAFVVGIWNAIIGSAQGIASLGAWCHGFNTEWENATRQFIAMDKMYMRDTDGNIVGSCIGSNRFKCLVREILKQFDIVNNSYVAVHNIAGIALGVVASVFGNATVLAAFGHLPGVSTVIRILQVIKVMDDVADVFGQGMKLLRYVGGGELNNTLRVLMQKRNGENLDVGYIGTDGDMFVRRRNPETGDVLEDVQIDEFDVNKMEVKNNGDIIYNKSADDPILIKRGEVNLDWPNNFSFAQGIHLQLKNMFESMSLGNNMRLTGSGNIRAVEVRMADGSYQRVASVRPLAGDLKFVGHAGPPNNSGLNSRRFIATTDNSKAGVTVDAEGGSPKLHVCGCIAETMFISTPTGKRLVRDLEAGDDVVSKDQFGNLISSKITKKISSVSDTLVSIFTKGQQISVSLYHELMTGTGLLAADKIRKGMTILGLVGALVVVDSVHANVNLGATTYNLSVASGNGYYYGTTEVAESVFSAGAACPIALKNELDKPEFDAVRDDFLQAQSNRDPIAMEALGMTIKEGDAGIRGFYAGADLNPGDGILTRVQVADILYKEGDAVSNTIRRNLEDLNQMDNYIRAEGADANRLKSSFQSTGYPEKWVEMKIPRNELENLYIAIRNNPPANIDPWTPNHKAQRWNNYKEGDGSLNFESWSNIYDGNLNKAVKGNQKVKDYAESNNIPTTSDYLEVTWQSGNPADISINIRGENVTGKRRHDLYVADELKAIEIKDYTGNKVYKSYDIEKEALMDIKLKEEGLLDEIEWIFLGEGPSGPLRTLLENGGITVTIQ